MKTAAIRKFRQTLRDDRAALGLWVTLESPSVTEMAVALGLDWVVIDAEHGHLDWKEIVEHLRATVRSDTVALVRVAQLDAGLIKRALDVGADGVVVPYVETAEQLKLALSYARYPTDGVRGVGAERATAWGQALAEHTADANENVLVVPIIETVRTVAEVPAMSRLPGTELFYFGPADFSATAGYRGQWEGPGVAEQILAAKDTLRAAGKFCGVVATSEDDILRRRDQGFRMIALGLDGGLLIRSLRSALKAAGRDRAMSAALEPIPVRPAPLSRPPEELKPDRPEVVTAAGNGEKFAIAPGIALDCLVGAHNQARMLTTGLVTFAPGAELPYHTHTFGESLTLYSGKAWVEVEGRRYHLEPLDNVVIPRGFAHGAGNLSADEPAVFHVALAAEAPTRTLVEKPSLHRLLPDTSTGLDGGERVNRFRTAPRFEAGPGTEFIDYFNRDLVPGFEMSGGYGAFRPGGRLPAHFHDFDESICIIAGTATCVVEGRRYAPAGGATAMVPRGRVHYFINDSQDSMAMIWVYAGPMPERIVVDERNATVEGSPWQ